MTTVLDVCEWRKPGPGCWALDQSHFVGAPTPLLQQFALPNLEAGLETAFERAGIPMRTFSQRMVNGKVYRRLSPLVGRDHDRTRPPALLLWLVFRLHPELRRRTRQARQAFGERLWHDELQRWHEERPCLIERNLALQDEDLAAFDDDGVAGTLRRSFANACDGYRLHFELRPVDAGPIGDLLVHCEGWGIPAGEVLGALAGSSPASSAPAETLQRLATIVGERDAGSIEEIRALGPEAAEALDAYTREYGWRMVTSYDIDGRTLIELPDALLTSIRAAVEPAPRSPDPQVAAAGLRERVPAGERARFDDLLGEARSVYGLRDDNGPLTIEWPTGLLRRAVLEVGKRLAERRALYAEEHACELSLEQLQELLSGSGPSAAEVAASAARRAELAVLRPPLTLGDAEPRPPEWVLPAPIRRTMRVLLATVEHLEAADERSPLTGTGIGVEAYRGRARVAQRPEDVLTAMEQGDVLVAPFTNPAYNTLLFVAGAVVCEEGGSLSHAAIMARELGISAVVGAAGAMTMISDGDIVEVDPVAGSVRVDSP